jgi:hypothetical protein
MMIYVFDKRWEARYIPSPGKRVRWFTVEEFQSPRNIAWFILHHAGNEPIDWLGLFAEGNNGELSLGTGLKPENAIDFSPLRGRFAKGVDGEGIEIHGCSVASDTPSFYRRNTNQCVPGKYAGAQANGSGYRLLAALADVTGTRVTAAIHPQYDDAEFHFEGPTLTVLPGGTSIFEVPASGPGPVNCEPFYPYTA